MSVAVVLGLLLATAPRAEAAYRYWSYWRRPPGAAGWTYSSAGAGYQVPDGAVEGWRFQPYGAANPSDPPPRSSASFGQICASVPPAEGMKRVAIVVDFGTSEVGHTCVRIPARATGYGALSQRADDLNRPPPRYNASGLLCAIDGRPPAPECGKQVTSPRPAATTPAPRPSATSTRPSPAPTAAATTPVVAATSANGDASTDGASAAASGTASAVASTSGSARGTPRVPASESGDADEVVLETPSATSDGTDDGGLPVPTLLGAGLVAALAAAAAVRMRSRT